MVRSTKKMKVKLFFFLLLLLPLSIYSQTIDELEDQREEVTKQIKQLQDSLISLESQIKRMEREKLEKNEKEEVQVSPEIQRMKVPEDAVLKSLPGELGKNIMKVEKGTVVQKIDEVKDYYLVCINGSCGYLSKSIFAKAAKDQLKKEK